MSFTRKVMFCAAALVFAAVLYGVPSAQAQNRFSKLDMAPNKKGGIEDMQDIKKFCGTKPLKVAYSDGWGGNYWRHITRAEFEDEAAKCPNITTVRYTDGEFKAEKQIADIRGLIAQHFDVIVVFADTGVAQLKVMRQATKAGIAVVPFSTGDAPFGKMGTDYLVRVTETQIGLGKMLAEWMVKTLHGKGNVIVQGGTPGNPMTASQAVGWKEVFAMHPGIKVLEGPVDTNWDPALAQKVQISADRRHHGRDHWSDPRVPRGGPADPGLGGPGSQRTELPVAGSPRRQPDLQARHRERPYLAGPVGLAQGLGGGQRYEQHRTQPDRPALLRGQYLVRSQAEGEVRQEPAADRDSVFDGFESRDAEDPVEVVQYGVRSYGRRHRRVGRSAT